MSWWKTLFGGSAAAAPSPGPEPEPDLSDLLLNEDPLYLDAARFVISTGRCSISALQRHLKIGYNRAACLVEDLESDRVISGMDQNGARRLLTTQQREASRLLPSKEEIERQRKEEELALRAAYLMEKYRDENVVQMIMEHAIWEGMSAGHLFDALGNPEAVDQKYFKQASREVWKYRHQGGNRYQFRVTLENGVVVGWDAKS